MLPEKPWRLEALIRLGLSVVICVCMGALMLCLMRVFSGGGSRLGLPMAVIVVGLTVLAVALHLARRPWDVEHDRARMLGFLACLYAGLTLLAVAQKLTHAGAVKAGLWQLVIAALSFQGAALALIGPFLRSHQTTWSDGFGFSHSRCRAVLLGLVTAMAFLPLAWLLQIGTATLLMRLRVGAEAQPAIEALRAAPTWLDRLPLGLVAIALAPPAEEMLFRGLMYPFLKRAGFPHLALWLTTLLFAAVHWNLVSFMPLVLLALVLTWLYERTGNLLAPIAAHSLFNALNFVALQFMDRAWTQPR